MCEKRVSNLNLELDTAAITQVLIIHHTETAIIKNIIEKLESINSNDNLQDSLYSCVEYTSYHQNHEDFVNKEAKRSIGYTTKIRVIFAVENYNKADLIVVSNKELVSYQEIINMYKVIIGESSNILNMDILKPKYNSLMPVKWGVPSWPTLDVFPKSYTIDMTSLKLSNFSTYKLDKIINALATTLIKYALKDCKTLIEENNINTKKIRTAMIDDSNSVNIKDEVEGSDCLDNDYEAQIVVTDLDNVNCEYYPCLASSFPVTISITKVKDMIQGINVIASEKFIHPIVFEQFANLFEFYINKQKDDCTVSDLLKLSFNEELYKEPVSIMGTSCLDYSKFDLIEKVNYIVTNYSDKVAVSDNNKSITYSELDKKSDIIAKKLLSYGIVEGDKVVVSLEQNVDLIIVMVAIIKVGGIYIPVDPNYPNERISFIVDDSGSSYFISNLQGIEFKNDIKIISPISLINDDIDMASKDIELPKNSKKNGYVIYTSGTTGQPKGVSVLSKNIVALVEATKGEFRLTENDVWTMFHSASFDFSVWEIWGCLLTGGHLVVVPRDIAKSPYDFYELLIKEKVTVMNQTPSAFYALEKIDLETKDAQLESIRLIIFGGEALNTYKLSSWFERYPVGGCRLVNMYGITETTVHVTYRNIIHREPEFLSKSIGVPLQGWKVSIRDKNGKICLYGMEGEIWVAGVGVSNGYLNREELTKKRFVIDPKNNERWYRSGDLGRMRPDGSIDYLGRIDNQVKIRGFRIELDEIRSVIQKIPRVRNVAVTVRDGENVKSSQKEVIAFVESADNVNSNEIRKYLKSKMPEYMIPSRIIGVSEIPITINGKVDYKALMLKIDNPELKDKTKDNNGNPYIAMWSKVLGHEVKENDNFFECGGNSLLAIELFSELKREGNTSLKLKDVYINSSPKEMKVFLSKSIIGDKDNE